MTSNEFLKAIGIKQSTKEIIRNTKVKQIVDYINENDIDIYENDTQISEQAFLEFLNTINSIEVALTILENTADTMNINYYPKDMARFYNLYDLKVIRFNKDMLILIDSEYLTYATKEWTQTEFLNYPYILHIGRKRITLKENVYNEDDDEYIENFVQNVKALNIAKSKNMLKEAISKLI